MSIQTLFGQNAVDIDLPTLAPTVVTAKSSTRVIWVQRIVFTPNTYALATLSFFDSLTLKVLGVITVPATAGPVYPLDYGTIGTRLTAGANLSFLVDTGASGRLHVESYQKFR